jgi:hypothetical protein
VLFRNTSLFGSISTIERGRFRTYATFKGEKRIVVMGLSSLNRTILRRADEGVTWCRGWSSRSARALEVAHALKPM